MLLPLVRKAEARVIYFLGMAKNAGKTVAFNALSREAAEAGVPVGLTSVGWDGELEDRLFRHAKPRIAAPAGSLVATSQALIEAARARLAVLAESRRRSQFGPVVVARVEEGGEVELAGPLRGSEVREVVDLLMRHGAALVLLDGAVDRWAAAAPSLSEGCVLATGAVVHREMTEVVGRTAALVAQFSLPAVRDPVLVELAGGLEDEGGGIAVTRDGRVTALSPAELFDPPDSWPPPDAAALIFGGSVPAPIFARLLVSPSLDGVTVVARDPTRLFPAAGDLERLSGRGARVEMLQPVRVIAVTANPVSPLGWRFPPAGFVEELAAALPGVPVVDVVAQLPPPRRLALDG